jgi:hypothetical protein
MELLNLSINSQGNIQSNINIRFLLIIFALALVFLYILYQKKISYANVEKITVSIPFGIGSVDIVPDQAEQNAAWSLYVELVTRIAVQPLKQDEGLLREALSSLYSLFPTTRQILKDVGPEAGVSKDSVGGIAIAVLNLGLRPFLAKWHPLLQEWEVKLKGEVSTKKHEKNWSEEKKLREEIDQLRMQLNQYAEALMQIAKIK